MTVQCIKIWAPIIAPTLTLVGVLVTVYAASRTYRRGQAEARKDRQRSLIAQLITDVRRLIGILEIFVPAAGKFKREDHFEWMETESGRRQNELNSSIHDSTVRSLCEVKNSRLRPLIIQLAVQHRGLMQGDEVVALLDDTEADDVRFKAVMAALGRVSEMSRTCSRLEIAAIETLPVEIDLPSPLSSLRQRLRQEKVVRRAPRSSAP